MNDIERSYLLLGLHPDSGMVEVEHAYRQNVRVWHPDKHQNSPAVLVEAQEKMIALNNARTTLRRYLGSSDRGAAPPRPATPATERTPRSKDSGRTRPLADGLVLYDRQHRLEGRRIDIRFLASGPQVLVEHEAPLPQPVFPGFHEGFYKLYNSYAINHQVNLVLSASNLKNIIGDTAVGFVNLEKRAICLSPWIPTNSSAFLLVCLYVHDLIEHHDGMLLKQDEWWRHRLREELSGAHRDGVLRRVAQEFAAGFPSQGLIKQTLYHWRIRWGTRNADAMVSSLARRFRRNSLPKARRA